MAGQVNKKSAEDLEALKEKIIAEARAEAERIIAEARAKAEQPKEEPKADPMRDQGEELVTIRLPLVRGEGAKFVAVNGENILIPRGKDVQIKKKFYWVLQQSETQGETAIRLMQGLADDYADKSTEF